MERQMKKIIFSLLFLLTLTGLIAQSEDEKSYFESMKIEAEQGDVEAQFELGNLYYNGEGVEQDYTEAVKWFRLAAEQGNASAQCRLGVCYLGEYGVIQDRKEAVKWFRLAAEQGDASAQWNLGYCYSWGAGVQDYKEAMKWYKLSAEQGHVIAQYSLGLSYWNGQDFKEAFKWFLLVSSNSTGEVFDEASKSRDDARKELTQSQIEEATREAEEIQKRIDEKE